MAIKSTGLIAAGLKNDFFSRFSAVETIYQDLCMRVASEKDSEAYRWLGQVPSMRHWTGGRQAKGLNVEAYDIDNMKYESTMEVDRDEIDDDQTGQIRIRVQEMAQVAATHKDYLLGQLLENGGTAGYLSYDGVTFFNAAHVFGSSGSNDNDTTSAAATGTDPTVTEMRDAIKLAVAALLGFKDDTGRPINMGMGGLVAIVPVGMYFAAVEAMNAAIIANTTNTLTGLARVVLNPWLTSTDKFYLAKVDSPIKPFVFQDRAPVEFQSLEGETETGFKFEKYQYGCRARYAIAYGDPLRIVRHTFT